MNLFRTAFLNLAIATTVVFHAGAQTTITGPGGTVTTDTSVKVTIGSSSSFQIFNSSNSELLRLQTNGYLGIGTTSPNRSLDVRTIGDSDGITLGRQADNVQTIQTYIDGQFANRTTYANGCCNGLLIQPDVGYVAIGTTSPAGVYKLEVAGQIYSSTGGYRFPDNTVQTTAASASSWTRTGSGSQFTMSTGDKVGVGTSTANRALDVNSNGDGIAIGQQADNKMAIQSYIDGHWADRTTYAGGCCNVLLLQPDAGSLGIGTSAPTARVEIGTMFPAQFVDLATQGVPNGYRLNLTGNGDIIVAGLQLGQTGLPVIRSTSNSTVYLNPTGGTVAIGTMSPDTTKKLFVEGHAHFNGTVTGTKIRAHYQDVAEWVPSADDLEPGTVVVLDKRAGNTVRASLTSYDTSVAGVVSADPGLILGEEAPTKEQIATFGRVRVRVDASRGAIEIGDLLVTSDVSGTAMKSAPVDVAGISMHRPGTIIGKALEPLKSGQGEILVLLSLQ